MKSYYKILPLIAVLLILAAGYFVYSSSSETNLEKKFRQIKQGMRVNDVLSILGKPVQILRPDSAHYEYFYFSGVFGKIY